MSIQLQPPVSLVKTEPPEEVLEEEISTDIKDIDIVYHPLCEDLIKSETVLEDVLENKHLESVQTQALIKAENSNFIKTENITQRNKSEDSSDGNVSRATGQGVVEVQASNEHSNALRNLENEQSILNFSKDLSERFISVKSKKSKNPKKTDFVECYKIDDTTLWKKEKEKIKVIKAPMIRVKAHEYTSLAKDKHVCNHCQRAFNTLTYLKKHIRRIHREVTTMYHCPYCPYKSKRSLRYHFIQKHKDTKDIQWFQCNLCKIKFKLKYRLTEHMKNHLKHKQILDGLDLRRHHCDKCNYKTDRIADLKKHNLVKSHISKHYFKNVEQGNILNKERHRLKPEEMEYFYCYHCSYKSYRKGNLKRHIFTHHFKNVKQGKRHDCNKCGYKTYTSAHLKRHNLTHLKPEEIQYFYCYHCSYKTKLKEYLKEHIFIHFKKEQVKFDCYICNFMTPKRESIIKHIKKHSKVQNKSEIKEEVF